MKSSEPGTRYVTTTERATHRRPAKLSRTMAYAASVPMIMARLVVTRVTLTLLRMYCRNGVFPSTKAKWSSVT